MRKREKCDSVGCPKMSPGVEKDRRKSTVPCVPMKVSRLRGDSKKKKKSLLAAAYATDGWASVRTG